MAPFVSEPFRAHLEEDDGVAAIPVCTIKSFPSRPQHCVVWAKQVFEQLYSTNVKSFLRQVSAGDVSRYGDGRDDPDNRTTEVGTMEYHVNSIIAGGGHCLLTPRALSGNGLEPECERVIVAAVYWAMSVFEMLFVADVKQMQQLHKYCKEKSHSFIYLIYNFPVLVFLLLLFT